nr:hypothetical protein CFP56_75658 [Quercus suber]
MLKRRASRRPMARLEGAADILVYPASILVGSHGDCRSSRACSASPAFHGYICARRTSRHSCFPQVLDHVYIPPDEVGCVVCRARRTVAVSSRGKLSRVAAAGARLGCADGYRVNGKVVYTTVTAMSAYRACHQIHCIEPEGFRRERHGSDLHVHPRQKLDDVRDCKRCQECKQSRETKSMDPKLKLTQESHDGVVPFARSDQWLQREHERHMSMVTLSTFTVDISAQNVLKSKVTVHRSEAEPDRSHSSNALGKRLISVTKVPYSCSSRYGRTRLSLIGCLDTECPANKPEATDSRGDGMISTDLPSACRSASAGTWARTSKMDKQVAMQMAPGTRGPVAIHGTRFESLNKHDRTA